MKKKTKKKSKSVSSLKRKADAKFSLWIRKRDRGICYTCKIKKSIKKMQCGHYENRGNNATRFDERNNHCQCVGCNIFKKGNLPEYAIQLKNQYGEGILEELHTKAKTFKQFTTQELEDIIKKYEIKCSQDTTK